MKKFRNFKARAACVLALSFIFTMCAPSVKVIADDIENNINVPAQTEIVSEETLPENGEGEETLPEDGEGEETLPEGYVRIENAGFVAEDDCPIKVVSTKTIEGYTSNTNVAAKDTDPPAPSYFGYYQYGKEVTFTWDHVDGVTGYRLYWSTDFNNWYCFYNLSAETVSCDATFTTTGVYYIAIASYIEDDGIIYESGVQLYLTICIPESVNSVGMILTSKTSAKISWEGVNGATEYTVEQCINNVFWEPIKTTTDTSITVSGLEAGNTYIYRVYVSEMYDFYLVNGEYSKIVYREIPDLVKPGIKLSSLSGANATLTWDTLIGADYYELYTYHESLGSWTLVGETTNTKMDITNLPDGVCKFRVRGCAEVDGFKFVSPYSSTVSATVVSTTLSAPTGLNVASNSQGKVTLKWNAVTGATGYEVYVYSASVGSWKKTATVTSATAAITHTSDGTYKYRVRAYKTVGSSKVYSKYSSTISAAVAGATLAAPTGMKVSSINGGTVTLKWNAVSGAAGYELYLYSKTAGSWKKHSTLTTTTKTIKHVANDLYKYRVRAYKTVNGSKVYSKYSSTVSATVAGVTIAAPTGAATKILSATSIRLSWNAVTNAEKYTVYRKTDDGSWEYLTSTTGKSVDITGLEAGSVYSFKVRVSAMSGESVTGSFSTPVEYTIPTVTKPTGLKASVNDTVTTLTWNAVTDAVGYDVYVYSTSEGSWKKDSTVTGVTTKITHSVNDVYKYRVRAYKTVDGVRFNSAYSSTVSATVNSPINNAPANVKAVFTSTTAGTLSWDAVDGANTYAVYRSVNGGSWVKLASPTKNSLTLSSFSRGYTYSYKVQVTKYNSQAITGAFSKEVALNVPAKFSAPTNVSVKSFLNDRAYLSWDSVEGAIDGCKVEKKVGSGSWSVLGYVDVNDDYLYNSITDYDVINYWRVTPYALVDGVEFLGTTSTAVSLKLTSATVKRALLIGNNDYVSGNDLPGTANDINAMYKLLYKDGYKATKKTDLSAQEIIDNIMETFKEADENDITLLYYSGHGATNETGAIIGVDGYGVTANYLAKLLSAIPGQIVVMFDSCGSGAAITPKGTDGTAEFDIEAFNESFVSAFEEYNNVASKQGEMLTDKFIVMTAASMGEYSWETGVSSTKSGGIFTYNVACAVGMDYSAGTFATTMPADYNSDNKITWAELYYYVYYEVLEEDFYDTDLGWIKQHVKAYPEDSSFVFFEK